MAKDQEDRRQPADRKPAAPARPAHKVDPKKMQKEVGGREGPEPTRYGDWEKKGIISDF
jgi:hypothetical protein